MQVSPTGLLSWATTSQSPAMNQVIVSISDKANQQKFHSFTLAVTGAAASIGPAGGIPSPNPPTASNGSPRKSLATTPIEGKEESRTIQLPGTISDVASGGNGRLLLLYFCDLKKIGVFDISLSKIVGYLPAADDDTLLAAGATRALVFNVSQGVMSRYRLDTLEREVSAQFPLETTPFNKPSLGAGSEGPAL